MAATAHTGGAYLRDKRRASPGPVLLFVVSVAGVIAAAFDVFNQGNGIAYSGGAYLVLVSSVLYLLAAFVVLMWPNPRWLRGVLLFLILLDLIGTGVAAYFLEAGALMIVMAVGFLAWLFCVFARSGRRIQGAAS